VQSGNKAYRGGRGKPLSARRGFSFFPGEEKERDCAPARPAYNAGLPMQYRTLGKTGLSVSALAFGGSSLGGAFGPIDETEAIRAVHEALEGGINLIDTAPYYGATRAETVLGRALRGIGRDRYHLATKVGRYGPEAFDFSAARTLASVDESLARLGVDHVDLIQVHDLEFGDPAQIVHETLPALARVREAGKARFIGITGLPIARLLEVLDQAGEAVEVIQSYCHYCLNDTALADAVPRLREAGVGLISSAPLAMRLLSDAGPPEWHPAPPLLKEKCAEAARYCREQGMEIGRLALQFALANTEIHAHVVGMADPRCVVENLRHAAEPPDETVLAGVLHILEPVHNLTWPSGKPR